MFFPIRLIGAAALLSGLAAALPRPDSSSGDEVAVSAPNGTPITDTAALSMQTAGYGHSSGSSYSWTTAPPAASSSPSYGSWGSSYTAPPAASSSPSYGSWGSSYTAAPASASPPSYSSASGWSSSQSWTTAAPPSYSSPTYGSGSSNWGNQNYNSCVQQCVASYGGLSSSTYTPPTTTSVSGYGSSGYGSSGSAATHTVIVAPTQGILRFVPFALNASVGDTVQFMWGANNHTVTKSSELTPCNKTSDAPFGSGEQNEGFVFTQVVNDTNPTFFYCGTPTHCEKGMFGIINPPNAFGSSTSVSSMMPPLAANSSSIAAYANYTNSKTSSNAGAAGWGGSIDMSALPSWSYDYVAENVMYTRTFLAANSEVLQPNGSVNLAAGGSTPLMYPQDLSAAVNSTGSTSATSSTPSSSSVPASSLSSAAISTSLSKVLLGLVVGFATFIIFEC